MKRINLFIFSVIIPAALLFVSWGNSTHRIIALIAEKHITQFDRLWIKELLGNESLADAAAWADVAAQEEAYKHTASWHFIHLPPGLKNIYELRFILKVQNDESKEDNIYTAIIKQEAILRDSAGTKSQRVVALKFLLSLVADLNDPSHIIIDDKEFYTGLVIPIKKNPNLFSYWNDDQLVSQAGKSYEAIADQINEETIKTGTRDPYTAFDSASIYWLWESYELNLKVNSEKKQENKTKTNYYRDHSDLIDRRIELAGLRLAGTLTYLYPQPVNGPAQIPPYTLLPLKDDNPDTGNLKMPPNVDGADAASRIGEIAIIRNKVYGHKDVGNVVLVYVGAPYPHQFLTLILEGVSRSFEKYMVEGTSISIVGNIIKYKGKPAIEVEEPQLLHIITKDGKKN